MKDVHLCFQNGDKKGLIRHYNSKNVYFTHTRRGTASGLMSGPFTTLAIREWSSVSILVHTAPFILAPNAFFHGAIQAGRELRTTTRACYWLLKHQPNTTYFLQVQKHYNNSHIGQMGFLDIYWCIHKHNTQFPPHIFTLKIKAH